MPVNVPRAYASPSLPGHAGGVRAPLSLASNGIGEAFDQLASVSGELAEAKRKARREAEAVKATHAATVKLNDLKLAAERDADWQGRPERWAERADAATSEILDGIEDEKVRATVAATIARQRERDRVEVERAAFKDEVDAAGASLDAATDDYARLAAAAPTDEERARFLSLGMASVAATRSAGYIGDTDAYKRQRGFLGKVDRADVSRLIREDPDAALDALNDPSRFRSLDPVQRETLTNRAQSASEAAASQRVAEADRAERAAEKAQKARQEQAAAEEFERIADGDIDLRRLAEKRDRREISPDDYRMLRVAADNAAAPRDDDDVLLAMEVDLAAGTLTRNRVLSNFASGLITRERMDSYLADLAREISEVEKNALSFVKDRVGGVTGPMAVLDTDASARQAAAIREYRERVRDGEAPWQVADDVAQRYAPVATLEGARRPRYFPGGEITRDSLERARQDTFEALQRGEIDEREAAAEAQRIRALTERLPAPAPARSNSR